MAEATGERPGVLLLGTMYDPAGEELLESRAAVRRLADPTEAGIGRALPGCAGVFVRYPTRLRADAIAAAPDLLVISTSGRGTDAVDIEAATAAGVAVVNNPGLGATPVSEHTLAMMLDLAKHLTHAHGALRGAPAWRDAQGLERIELAGRTLGVVGCGQIGTEVARKAVQGFRMRVLVYDPYVPASKAEAVGATWVDDLQALLRESDFVSLHPELTDETRGMIGEAELRQMRPDAFLVNTARGRVLQTDALVRALREGWIAGAAIDVCEPEPPPPESPLYSLANLVLSPHAAGLTVEARRLLALSAASQILQVLAGERPPNLVNAEVWERVRRRRETLMGEDSTADFE